MKLTTPEGETATIIEGEILEVSNDRLREVLELSIDYVKSLTYVPGIDSTLARMFPEMGKWSEIPNESEPGVIY